MRHGGGFGKKIKKMGISKSDKNNEKKARDDREQNRKRQIRQVLREGGNWAYYKMWKEKKNWKSKGGLAERNRESI